MSGVPSSPPKIRVAGVFKTFAAKEEIGRAHV